MFFYPFSFKRTTDPEIDVVPPLTLTALLLADKDQSGTLDDKKNGNLRSLIFIKLLNNNNNKIDHISTTLITRILFFINKFRSFTISSLSTLAPSE